MPCKEGTRESWSHSTGHQTKDMRRYRGHFTVATQWDAETRLTLRKAEFQLHEAKPTV